MDGGRWNKTVSSTVWVYQHYSVCGKFRVAAVVSSLHDSLVSVHRGQFTSLPLCAWGGLGQFGWLSNGACVGSHGPDENKARPRPTTHKARSTQNSPPLGFACR